MMILRDQTKLNFPKFPLSGFHVPVLVSLGVLVIFCVVGMIWLKVTSNKERVAKQFIPLYEDLQK